MNKILRFCLVLLVACELSSCVVPYVEPVSSGWEGAAAGTLVGGVTTGMVAYSRPAYYGGSYYRRGYYGGGYYGGYYGRRHFGVRRGLF